MFGFGKKKAPSKFIVYDSGTDGNLEYELRVGEEIDSNTAEQLAKISNGDILYAIHYYADGVKEQQFVSKDVYLKMKATVDQF
jgi:hypothetical protein